MASFTRSCKNREGESKMSNLQQQLKRSQQDYADLAYEYREVMKSCKQVNQALELACINYDAHVDGCPEHDNYISFRNKDCSICRFNNNGNSVECLIKYYLEK